ncbi:hypothetical protein B0J17DRAFT_352384 [Rhizoctonia solani]|nr:hypothetical protein B0J17DRAFT_352384 [Rhizoctonia solani]
MTAGKTCRIPWRWVNQGTKQRIVMARNQGWVNGSAVWVIRDVQVCAWRMHECNDRVGDTLGTINS